MLNMDNSWKQYAMQKKPVTEYQILYNTIHIKC